MRAPPCNGCATVLAFIKSADQSGPMAAAADPDQDVILVPAFVGLGAPHWDADARGALFGLTRGHRPERAGPRRAGKRLLPDRAI